MNLTPDEWDHDRDQAGSQKGESGENGDHGPTPCDASFLKNTDDGIQKVGDDGRHCQWHEDWLQESEDLP